MKNNEPLPTQTCLPLDDFCNKLNRRIRGSRCKPGRGRSVQTAVVGRDDGDGRILADQRRARLAGLRELEGEPLFVADDEGDYANPAISGPRPTADS
jgi:hypothetical protein